MQDYKNTAEGQAVAEKYADILHARRPAVPEKHPRMALADRAKIFSSFAALRGYEGKIAEEERKLRREVWQEPTEEEREKLSEKLALLRRGMSVQLCWFQPECSDETGALLGTYCRLRGVVERVDGTEKQLRIGNATVAFRWIRQLELPRTSS